MSQLGQHVTLDVTSATWNNDLRQFDSLSGRLAMLKIKELRRRERAEGGHVTKKCHFCVGQIFHPSVTMIIEVRLRSRGTANGRMENSSYDDNVEQLR